jgi:hypothetical protein
MKILICLETSRKWDVVDSTGCNTETELQKLLEEEHPKRLLSQGWLSSL